MNNFITGTMEWHSLWKDCNDVPKETAWYIVKVRGSDDYKCVFGYENINANTCDAWAKLTPCNDYLPDDSQFPFHL